MVNGELSSPFHVTRGVCQGDPLSCLLFNIAIEPLAELMRSSPTIQGFKIPHLEERVISALFADDAAAYLSKHDKLSDLLIILDTWCLASSAKFNVGKTEIIPVGSKEYWAEVAETRKLNLEDEGFPVGSHVLTDGESARYLGAHIGNNTNDSTPWLPLVERIESILNWCLESYPTFEAKRH